MLFTQEVMILRIDSTQDWYYQKCDECGGKLKYGYVHGHCHQYGAQPKPEKTYGTIQHTEYNILYRQAAFAYLDNIQADSFFFPMQLLF